MKRLLVFIFLGLSLIGISQSNEIKILVKDSANRSPLPYANIYLKNSGVSSNTDEFGVCLLPYNKEKSDTLIISYIGYASKHIPINTGQRNLYEVYIFSNNLSLRKVEIIAEDPIKAEKIIKNAIKNTKDNYSQKSMYFNCLFRQTIKENGKAIQLDEAIAEVNYTSYPKKKLDRSIWKDWYYEDRYAFDLSGNRYILPLLNDFNTKEDQQKIVATRSSQNWSDHGIEANYIGGPLYLTALDKIKYQYDFLNPKILNQYQFTKEDTQMVNGTQCYVVSFLPKDRNRKFHIDQSRKNKSAIYLGKIYIEKKSFAVVKFEYQLALDRNFGFFNGRMPLDFKTEVNYQKGEGIWFLQSIEQKTKRNLGKTKKGIAIIQEFQKKLFVLNTNNSQKNEIPDSLEYLSTRYSDIHFYKDNYKPSFFEEVNIPDRFKISTKTIAELGKTIPLHQQFINNDGQFDKTLNAPIASTKDHTFFYHELEFEDNLHWMSLIENEGEFLSYIKKENAYGKNLLKRKLDFQKRFFRQLDHVFVEDTIGMRDHKIGSYFYEEDSLNHDVLFHKTDSLSKELIFNLTEFTSSRNTALITRILPNPRKDKILVVYENTGEMGKIGLVFENGNHVVLDSLNHLYSIEWYSNNQLIYGSVNAKGRSDQLRSKVLESPEYEVLYTEVDPTFDIEVNKQYEKIYCTIQSKSENEIYEIKQDGYEWKINQIVARKNKVNYLLKNSNEEYLLVDELGKSDKILKRNSLDPKQWNTISESLKGEHIVDFEITPNCLILSLYDQSIPKLKYKFFGEKKWNDIELPDKLGRAQLNIGHKQSNTIEYSFSSSKHPYARYEMNLDTKETRIIEQSKIKNVRELDFIKIERNWANGYDGEKIPITLISHRLVEKTKGVILKVYGAYGAITSNEFKSEDLILLRSGFSIAYCHVRGESILGNEWYESGRVLNKLNSMKDYISCAEFLIKKEKKWKDKLIAYGSSAGGLLVAMTINERPDLFNTAILDHPFLDVTNTMMDSSLPLTEDEYKEWGNPNDKNVFEYIQSYSPYQNIKNQAYPNVLILGAYLDYQTPIWQIAKYSAKLREYNSGNNEIVFITDLQNGHGGSTTGNEWKKTMSEIWSFAWQNLNK